MYGSHYGVSIAPTLRNSITWQIKSWTRKTNGNTDITKNIFGVSVYCQINVWFLYGFHYGVGIAPTLRNSITWQSKSWTRKTNENKDITRIFSGFAVYCQIKVWFLYGSHYGVSIAPTLRNSITWQSKTWTRKTNGNKDFTNMHGLTGVRYNVNGGILCN